jgi:hypothetical protein
MKKYRLKPEAVQFFKEKYATAIYTYDTWESVGVDMIALEEVQDAYLTFGHKTSEISSSLSGWDANKGSHFLFTIHFPSTKFMEHDKFCNGKIVRELMNKIQRNIDNFYSDFVNE